jgi:hypothetical protein
MKGEKAFAQAALAFLTAAAPWTGTQADLHAAITPDPAPPGWPLATQLINILSRQYLPQTARSRTAPRATYGIEKGGKSKGRNVYRISLTRTKR